MKDLRQAAQQVLQELERINAIPHLQDLHHAFDGEITDLRAALAEPEQEPVAWMDIDDKGQRYGLRYFSDGNAEEVPLYTAPTPRKPLTDEEINAALVSTDPETKRLPPGFRDFARAIERHHGIGEQHE